MPEILSSAEADRGSFFSTTLQDSHSTQPRRKGEGPHPITTQYVQRCLQVGPEARCWNADSDQNKRAAHGRRNRPLRQVRD